MDGIRSRAVHAFDTSHADAGSVATERFVGRLYIGKRCVELEAGTAIRAPGSSRRGLCLGPIDGGERF